MRDLVCVAHARVGESIRCRAGRGALAGRVVKLAIQHTRKTPVFASRRMNELELNEALQYAEVDRATGDRLVPYLESSAKASRCRSTELVRQSNGAEASTPGMPKSCQSRIPS